MRILYGLIGIGIGHAIRGNVVLKELSKKHDLMISVSGAPYSYMKKNFKNRVHQIPGFEFHFKNNTLKNCKTFTKNLKLLSWKSISDFRRTVKEIKAFNPEVVISDWEFFSAYVAKRYKLPLINLSNENQHFFIKKKFGLPKHTLLSFLKARITTYPFVLKTKYNLVTAFFETKLRNKKGVLVTDPILRKNVVKSKPKEGDYILVYQSSKSYKNLIKILGKIKHKFIVYGFGVAYKEKNMVFKKFSDDTFIKDLINSKAIITNGGFSLLTEAIYLNKPILTVPIKKHFEQIANARHIQEKNYGEYHKDLDQTIIKNFINNLSKYKHNKIKTDNNFFAILENVLEEAKEEISKQQCQKCCN